MTKVNKGFYTLEYCDDCGELLVFSGWDYRGEDILIEQYGCPVCEFVAGLLAQAQHDEGGEQPQ